MDVADLGLEPLEEEPRLRAERPAGRLNDHEFGPKGDPIEGLRAAYRACSVE